MDGAILVATEGDKLGAAEIIEEITDGTAVGDTVIGNEVGDSVPFLKLV